MINQHRYYVYMLTNKGNTVIYVGVTNNLENRVRLHEQSSNAGFEKKNACNKLVYYEEY